MTAGIRTRAEDSAPAQRRSQPRSKKRIQYLVPMLPARVDHDHTLQMWRIPTSGLPGSATGKTGTSKAQDRPHQQCRLKVLQTHKLTHKAVR